MGDKGFEGPAQSEPAIGVPVNPGSARDTIAVVSDGFCVPHDVVFVLQQNINPRSTEVYNVIDSAGAPQFRVFAVSTSGSRMHIVDRQGAVILTLKSKSFSVHNKWYIFSGNSSEKADKIATVKPQSGSVTAEIFLKGRANRHADVTDGRGKKAKPVADFRMEGNQAVTYGKIEHVEDGYAKPVAELNKIQQRIERGAPIPNHIDAYSLHTLPGIDSVFMLAVTVALDEALFSPQQMLPYGPYNRYGYGGYGYGGYGYGGFGYGAPLLLGAGLLAPLVLFGGFW
ncbi:hypothetical protein ABBQ38_009627 [Trebouxia sp. C0009 RCD-2024]